jgi:hypothetical protein
MIAHKSLLFLYVGETSRLSTMVVVFLTWRDVQICIQAERSKRTENRPFLEHPFCYVDPPQAPLEIERGGATLTSLIFWS